MNFLRAIFRITLTGLVLGFVAFIVYVLSFSSKRVNGVKLCALPITPAARFALRLYGLQLHCPDAERIRQHRGFLLPNHISTADVIVMLSIGPTRFLSTYEIANYWLAGRIAKAIDTVFVNRGDKESRSQARDALSQMEPFPPIALFPEGGIIPPPEILKPFRHGAFEIMIQGNYAFLPCVLIYDRLDIAFWRHDETFLQTLWRLALNSEPLNVEVRPLRVVTPRPDDDPVQLALETHGAMNAVLSGSEGKVLEEDI